MLSFCYTIQSSLSFLGKNRLALSKSYEYEILNLNLLYRSRYFLNNFLNNLLRFLSKLITEIVDGGVQSINLCLIAELGNLEVVSTVRITKLIYDTCIQLSISLVDIVFNTTVAQSNISYRIPLSIISRNEFIIQAPNNCWLNINLPSLAGTEVECKIQT